MGIASNNPLLCHRQYEVWYIDGRTEVLRANIVAENLLSQVDDDVHQHLLIDKIEDHRLTEESTQNIQGGYNTRGKR